MSEYILIDEKTLEILPERFGASSYNAQRFAEKLCESAPASAPRSLLLCNVQGRITTRVHVDTVYESYPEHLFGEAPASIELEPEPPPFAVADATPATSEEPL